MSIGESPLQIQPDQLSIHPQCNDPHISVSFYLNIDVDIENGNSFPYMAHPLIIYTLVSLQSPLWSLVQIFFLCPYE